MSPLQVWLHYRNPEGRFYILPLGLVGVVPCFLIDIVPIAPHPCYRNEPGAKNCRFRCSLPGKNRKPRSYSPRAERIQRGLGRPLYKFPMIA